MDPRLKQILDQKAEDDRIAAEKQAEEARRKEAAAKALEQRQRVEAKAWVEKHLFTAIENAVKRNSDSLYLSDYSFNRDLPDMKNIPVAYIAEEAAKIDGLRVVSHFYDEDRSFDSPGYPAHYVYYIKWGPDKTPDYRYR